MGVVFMATADQGAVSMWDLSELCEVSNTVARTGTYSFVDFYGNTDSRRFKKTVAARADYYMRVAVYTTRAARTDASKIMLQEDNTEHIVIQVNTAAGRIDAYRGATLLGSGTAPITINTWYCLEIYGKVHDSAGVVTVKVNGVTDINLTGQDTQNGGTAVINNVNIQNTGGSGAPSYYDDIIIRDDAWPGTGGIYVLLPTGAGDDASWTPSAGDPYACVNEAPPDFTDYISTAAAVTGTKHNFAMENMTGVFSSIAVVCVAARSKLDASGSGNIKTYVDSGGSESAGAAVAQSTSEGWTYHYMTVNPADSAAWEKADVDGLLAGVQTA